LIAVGLTRALRVFSGWSEALGPLGNFIVTVPVIVQGIFLSLFVGMLAGVVPSYGAARKSVAETLHEIF
jgi:ABC-type antimicrobial peptide transport system permease subunit